MPFMQCVTEESDEQNPFVLDLNGGLILETVNKYCLLHYSGKIFRIFLLAISKRTSRLLHLQYYILQYYMGGGLPDLLQYYKGGGLSGPQICIT